MLQSMGSQRIRHDLATEQQQQQRTELARLLEWRPQVVVTVVRKGIQWDEQRLRGRRVWHMFQKLYITQFSWRREKKRPKSNVVAGKGGYRGYEMI